MFYEYNRKQETLACPVQPRSALVTFKWRSSFFTLLVQWDSFAVGEEKGGTLESGSLCQHWHKWQKAKYLILNCPARNFRDMNKFLFSCSAIQEK